MGFYGYTDYAAYRAAYAARSRMTAYERANADAETAKARKRAEARRDRWWVRLLVEAVERGEPDDLWVESGESHSDVEYAVFWRIYAQAWRAALGQIVTRAHDPEIIAFREYLASRGETIHFETSPNSAAVRAVRVTYIELYAEPEAAAA